MRGAAAWQAVFSKTVSLAAASITRRRAGLRVLNAGDGVHADPLAALALLRAILCAKPDLTRLAVTLVGDVRHSGLARSLIHALTTLGVPELRVAAPPSLLPEGLPQLGVFPFSALDEGLRDADVIILLPLSAEAVAAGRLPSPRDYAAGYRLSPGRWPWRGPDALLLSAAGLHAGIEAEVAFDAALARAGHERDALEHALRLAALRLLSDSLGRTLAPGARMRLHITNGRLIDPAAGVDRRADLYIADGHVAAVDVAPAGFQADRRIEADGLAVLPGLVDLCARLAGPDGSPSPDALRAALTGGVTVGAAARWRRHAGRSRAGACLPE